jgi:hypothetical protein
MITTPPRKTLAEKIKNKNNINKSNNNGSTAQRTHTSGPEDPCQRCD